MQTLVTRKCNATKQCYVPATERFDPEPFKRAYYETVDLDVCVVHYFSTEARDGESYPVAIVEDSTGQLHVALVKDVKFITPHESLITPHITGNLWARKKAIEKASSKLRKGMESLLNILNPKDPVDS